MRWKHKIIILLGLALLLQKFWMNPLPYAVKEDGKWSFPLFNALVSDHFSSKDYRGYEVQVWPPLPYHPEMGDAKARGSKPPFYRVDDGPFIHLLGTDALGRDVMAGLISGLNYALLIGLAAMIPAAFFGWWLGFFAGFFGNRKIRVHLHGLVCFGLFLGLGLVYAFAGRPLFSIACLGLGLGSFFLPGKENIHLPIDLMISKLMELIQSIPGLVLVIFLGSLFGRSWWQLALIIALVSWTVFARYVRAEVMLINRLDYVQAGKSIGLGWFKLGVGHFFPNIWPQIRVILAYGIAGAVMIESSLSFIGIGLEYQAVTWGSILQLGKRDLDSWWLLCFPAMALMAFLFALHRLNLKKDLSREKTII